MIKLSRITNRKAKVLINPTRKEIREISKINDPVNNVRAVNFILDLTNKKFYVFSPNKSHDEIAESIPTLKRVITGSLVRMDGDKEWIVECLSGFEQNDKVIKQLIKKVYLKEAFVDSMKTREGVYVEIYANPSQKEIDDASGLYSFGGQYQKLVRFIYDTEDKKLYVFSPDVFHGTVMAKLGHEGRLAVDNLYTGKFPHGTALKVKHGGTWSKWSIDNLKGTSGGESDFDKGVMARRDKTLNMITGFLNESFHSGYKSSIDNSYGEIYVNPTVREILEIANRSFDKNLGKDFYSVNFIYDELRNKFYVFPWNEWHEKIIKKLGIGTGYKYTPSGQLYKIGNGPWFIKNEKIPRGELTKEIRDKINKTIDKLNEEFVFSVNDYNTYYTVYKVEKPSDEDDLTKAAKVSNDIRFIANALDKGFYVFSSELSHNEVAKQIGVNIYQPTTPVIAGVIEDRHGRWTVVDSFNVYTAMEDKKTAFLKKVFESDWSFVQRFVDINNFLADAKKQWIERDY